MLNELKNIGLSDNEAKVYLAMLELGPAPVLEIAAKAGINRPTAYFQIETLKKMGLVSSQNKGNKQLFVAESPDQLEFIINRETKVIEQKKAELSKVLPELKTLYNLAEDKPIVRFFEGLDGLIKMQDEFLKSKPKEILAITSADDVFKVFPKQLETYTPERVKRKIHSRGIYTSSKGDFLKATDKQMLRQTKYVKAEDLPFHADITIFGNSVAIASLRGKLSGTIIEDKGIADSFKSLFEFNWKLIK
jgi:HTH-type transcriptional regulator, sugar sensing transcriptional regulator